MTLQTYPAGIETSSSHSDIVALDLFAGTGWGVACQRLGIEEFGVELMEEAVQTRTANGMKTILRDVWDGLDDGAEMLLPEYNLLIASPPCQTFSMAGSGSGRKALDEVIEAIGLEAYKRPADLKAFGDKHDDRTALVLTPLAYVWRDRPKYVAMEQVPTVLPVWEACAKVMREWGYEVKTAVLHAEQYGVPQTRKRAILVAKLDAYVDLPTPTHSRYYPTNPTKLDPGVEKWVSMAEALGWGRTVPSPTYCNSGHGGAGIEWGGNSVRKAMREQSVTEDGWIRKDGAEPGTNDAIRVSTEDAAALQSYPTALRSNYGTSGDPANRGERTADQPAPTMTSKANRNKWDGEDNMTAEEAAALQSYPTGRGLTGRPSPTITGGGTETGGAEPIAKYHERYTNAPDWEGSTDRLSTDEAAALQTYPSGAYIHPMTNGRRGIWPTDEPAPTIRGVNRPMPAGYSVHDRDACNPEDAHKRLSEGESSTLQTYDRPFVWKGTKTKIFLQIGNAVPPLLAQHILAALLDDSMDLL